MQALSGEDITIYGDGGQTRSFCFVDDLIEGLVRLMNNDTEVHTYVAQPPDVGARYVCARFSSRVCPLLLFLLLLLFVLLLLPYPVLAVAAESGREMRD